MSASASRTTCTTSMARWPPTCNLSNVSFGWFARWATSRRRRAKRAKSSACVRCAARLAATPDTTPQENHCHAARQIRTGHRVHKWEQVLAINLSSSFYTTKAALPGMKARNCGRIVNIASAHALVASPFKSAYVAAKHGVLGLTKAVALEVAETAITCNAVCPGYVKTPLVEGQIKDQAKVHNMSEEQV